MKRETLKTISLLLSIMSITSLIGMVYFFTQYEECQNKLDIAYDLPDEYGDTLLRWAIYNKEPHFISFLVENGADINYKNNWKWTPLFWAVRYNDTETVKLLVENGADITIKDYENDTAYSYAEYLNQTEMLKYLE